MSGLNEIEDWTDDNIDYTEEDNAKDLYDTINQQFEDDNRNPLDDILLDDKDAFMKFLEKRIKENEDLKDFKPEFEPPEKEEPEPSITESIVISIGNAISSLRRFFRF